MITTHCVKKVLIRNSSGPYFSAFGLNTERHFVSFRIQSKCKKIRTKITPNKDNFCAVTLPYNFSVAMIFRYTLSAY